MSLIQAQHSAAMIAVISVVTIIIRFLPFAIFRGPTPKVLEYLGKVLPGAIMGMLVIYCFRNTQILAAPHAVPEAIASAVVILLYLWKRSILPAIAIGTILYMILVQSVFL